MASGGGSQPPVVPPSGGAAEQTQQIVEGFTLRFSTDRVVGNGSFGLVYEAKVVETGETVAIKRVLQDKRFKNRELQIMKLLRHPNVCLLRHHFYQTVEKDKSDGSGKEEETYLNLVLEYVPETVYKVTRAHVKLRNLPPMLSVKLYTYQMLRSLAYLHSVGICHRDIKPQNLLVDSATHVLKLCDFGSAKALLPGEPSVAYICSRYYRAPELIFGATEYTTAIDVWSAGCVAAELLLGHPLFPGETGVDQLVEIIKVLGTPTKEEVEAMNPNYTEFKFPQIRAYPWSKIFRKPRATNEAIDLISRMLSYVPSQRVTTLEACAHPFFDELRSPTLRLPGDLPAPVLFNWSESELAGASVELREALVPAHARQPGWTSARPMAVVPPVGCSGGEPVYGSGGVGGSGSGSGSAGGSGVGGMAGGGGASASVSSSSIGSSASAASSSAAAAAAAGAYGGRNDSSSSSGGGRGEQQQQQQQTAVAGGTRGEDPQAASGSSGGGGGGGVAGTARQPLSIGGPPSK